MTSRKWIGIFSIALCSSLLVTGNLNAANNEADSGFTLDDLALRSAGDLVDICTIAQDSEHYDTALAFCYGFFEGTIRYAEAITGRNYHEKLVCAPEGTTRLEAVEVFVTYMNGNTQYLSEAPVDAIYRALMPKWPCEK